MYLQYTKKLEPKNPQADQQQFKKQYMVTTHKVLKKEDQMSAEFWQSLPVKSIYL